MAALFPQFFDVRKVTINANKNGAGGYTLFTPIEQYTKYATKKFMLANLIIALGGRAAEVYLNNHKYKPNIFDNHVFKGIELTSLQEHPMIFYRQIELPRIILPSMGLVICLGCVKILMTINHLSDVN